MSHTKLNNNYQLYLHFMNQNVSIFFYPKMKKNVNSRIILGYYSIMADFYSVLAQLILLFAPLVL